MYAWFFHTFFKHILANRSHTSEPGCAIRAALESGSLSPEQWKNYQIQVQETRFVENRSDYLRQKREFQKTIAKHVNLK
jgi:hypothetical protein